ncbi:hypothetical protein [Streptomyces nanshensis]|uniref:Transcriptional regulator n=1 Tax=Streptomyces nanshensis TaxID=518642 RepID=A0A1E7KZF7_9ACTN|nr:hypothetical protein [Streptomyces nanshensis]OEV09261.1 hypothetical protein AN218_22665 [Streptomyces nanshensis]
MRARRTAEAAVDETAGPQQPQHPASPQPAARYRGRPHAAQQTPAPTPQEASARGSSAPRRWPAAALDVTESGTWTVDVPVPAPAGTKLTDWFAWLGTGLPLRVDRIHSSGRNQDGIVCLSAAALTALGLPASFPTTPKAVAKLQEKLAKAAASVGMEISEELGPVIHAFRRKGAPGGPKASTRVILTPWLGQGDEKQQAVAALTAQLAADLHGTPDALTLARRIRTFVADLGVAPGASPATTSMRLLEAARPRTEWVEDEDSGDWQPKLREGALPAGDTTVPPAAGARHPLTRELLDKGQAVCADEDYKWWARELTDEEKARPWVVAVDVCASYLSVTESLRLPAGPLTRAQDPQWDPKTAGLWWCDFTVVPVDEELPHPATFHGMPPEGPGWYATPTVAYMVTAYGFDPGTITDAYLSDHTVPLLKEWTGRIRTAYKRTYAILGLKDSQTPQEFLDAYATHKDGETTEEADALVLATAYKQVYKSGIGKWADSAARLEDDAWLEKVAGSWEYRPEIRFHIVSAARVAVHRRLRKTFQEKGRAPIAVNYDSVLYATDEPTPVELLAYRPDGKPLPGTVRLGIGPGSHKHEATIPLDAVTDLMDAGEHPSRLTNSYDTAGAVLAA